LLCCVKFITEVFFTLNPADTKHQFTVSFASKENFDEREEHSFFLTLPEDEKNQFFAGLKPLQLQRLVADDPVAAVRCFYLLNSLVCELLFYCTIDPSKLSPDGVASLNGEGVAGFVRSIAGAVEAQARWSLHLHLLLSILGFKHPEDLRKLLTEDFAAGVRQIWAWISTKYWCSPEGFASYLAEPAALDALRSAKLVPWKQARPSRGAVGQRELLERKPCGVDRIAQTLECQLAARGIPEEEAGAERPRSRFQWTTPDFYRDEHLSSPEWAAKCSLDFNAGVIDSGTGDGHPNVVCQQQ
jgi:hypothetical protein